ncbi:hypothetical protein Gotur_024307 [Gossypium turneri]
MSYLEQAGFGSAALIRMFDLRYDLLSALVEQWRPETHTFHFTCGECMVTLEDVAMQLGLPIDGSPVTGVSSFTDPAALCYQLLGDSPEDDESNFTSLKFTWLKGLRRSSSVILRALSDDKPFCCRHGQMHDIAAVLCVLSDAIFGIGSSPTVCLSTSEQVESLSRYREVAHYPDIPTHDRTSYRERVYMDAIP